MRAKALIPVLLTVVLGAVLVPATAGAFNAFTREAIVLDAVSFSPKEVQVFLKANMPAVEEGMQFDYTADAKVDPRSISQVYETLVKRLRDGSADPYYTARSFGVVAALVSEAVSPGYLNSSDDLDPALVVYNGPNRVEDPQALVTDLMETYRPFWYDRREEVLGPLYEITVNQIADIWAQAWVDSGQDPGRYLSKGAEIRRQDAMRMEAGGMPVAAAKTAAASSGGGMAQDKGQQGRDELYDLLRQHAEAMKNNPPK